MPKEQATDAVDQFFKSFKMYLTQTGVHGYFSFVVECGDPGGIDNAVRGASSWPYTVGTAFAYTCESCYTGGGSITCQENGQWTQKPTCTGEIFCRNHILSNVYWHDVVWYSFKTRYIFH